MVKRQQVEEFVRRLIFPISQAAVAVSEKSSSYINYFAKFYLRGSLGDCSIQVNDNTNWDSVKSDRDRLLEADIAVIDGKQIREFNNRPLNTRRQLYTVPLNRGSNVYPCVYVYTLVLTSQSHSKAATGRLQQQHKFDSAVSK